MDLQLIDAHGQPVGFLSASDAIFGRPYNEPLVHQLVSSYLSNRRQATRAQKTRSEVARSTRKPWRQKGTGRARAGMASSPLWRGGGRAFPASPCENFTKKINRKMYRVALACIYSRLHADSRLLVADQAMDVDQPKTRLFNEKARAIGRDSFLYVDAEISENLYLAARNLEHYAVCDLQEVNPIALLRSDCVILTRSVVSALEESLVC